MLNDQDQTSKQKQYQYSAGVVLLFLFLIFRLFYLQVYKQDQYLKASESNRIRQVVLKPTRGLIFDRNGEILVDNYPSYSVNAIPFEVQRSDTVLQLASLILDMDVSEMRTIISKTRTGYFTPVRLKRSIDFETLTRIEEYKLDLPGIGFQIDPKRSYPSGVDAPHLFGYLGELTNDDFSSYKDQNVRIGDIVGKKGLEKIYDKEMRGSDGCRFVEVDVLGREIRRLEEKPEILPAPGKNLHLTIDVNLQKYLEMRMDSLRGGAVVVDCSNGEVLALVSKPDYDPQIFSKPMLSQTWNNLVQDEDKPLYDRMVQSLYPPGSTFKVVLVAAALEKKIINPSRTEYCHGFYKFGNKVFDCWKIEGHGKLDLLGAIEQSCNVYFYTLGLEVGLDNWAEFAKIFMFDKPTGIDLMAEHCGLVPDRKYLDECYGKKKWSRGLILNQSIGQGDVLVTPLQMVRLAMIIGNEGVYHQLHLIRYIEEPISHDKKWTTLSTDKISGISSQTYQILKEGMRRVVQAEHGTAKAARVRDVQVAGKTGTAENPHGEPHAWFIGFAPVDEPKIAICVLVENGGSGGGKAAPIAGEILNKYFTEKNIIYATF